MRGAGLIAAASPAETAGNARRNAAAFLAGPGLIATLVAAWTMAYPPDFADPSQAAVLRATFIVPLVVLSAGAVWLSIRSGMTPDPLVGRIGRAILSALGSGLILGLLVVALDTATGFSDAVATRLGVESIHIAFPASVGVYTAGAIAVECLYRLIPVSLLYYLVAHSLLRGRAEAIIFWTLAVLSSLLEPLSQAGLAGRQPLIVLLFGCIFMFNFAEALLWRRFGWIALITSRLAFYFVWHVMLGPNL